MIHSYEIKRITEEDDLAPVVTEIQAEKWDKDNDLKSYDVESSAAFVANPDNYLLIAYIDGKPVGVVLAMKLIKPYKDEDWFYVDEVDVMPAYRRKGVGSALMNKVFEIANGLKLDEVWLGTEPDNTAANKLYESLNPSETEQFIGYTYKLSRNEQGRIK